MNKMIWITGFPTGTAEIVEVIEERKDLSLIHEKYYYIRKSNGGTDTTTSHFLFDIPKELKVI